MLVQKETDLLYKVHIFGFFFMNYIFCIFNDTSYYEVPIVGTGFLIKVTYS
jgi:hypothetical protein